MSKLRRTLEVRFSAEVDECESLRATIASAMNDLAEHHRLLEEDGLLSRRGSWEHPESGVEVTWIALPKEIFDD